MCALWLKVERLEKQNPRILDTDPRESLTSSDHAFIDCCVTGVRPHGG